MKKLIWVLVAISLILSIYAAWPRIYVKWYLYTHKEQTKREMEEWKAFHEKMKAPPDLKWPSPPDIPKPPSPMPPPEEGVK